MGNEVEAGKVVLNQLQAMFHQQPQQVQSQRPGTQNYPTQPASSGASPGGNPQARASVQQEPGMSNYPPRKKHHRQEKTVWIRMGEKCIKARYTE